MTSLRSPTVAEPAAPSAQMTPAELVAYRTAQYLSASSPDTTTIPDAVIPSSLASSVFGATTNPDLLSVTSSPIDYYNWTKVRKPL